MVQLVNDIVGGAYAPGATLPTEADLGAKFGVSRTVVRESVKLLQDKGLIRIVQGKGTLVTDPRSWDLIDDVVLAAVVRHDDTLGILDELVLVRAALEREMAAAAAGRAAAAERELLTAAFRVMERAADDVAEFAAADVDFHDAVMDISGQRLARAIVTSIHGKARTTGRYHGAATAARIEETIDEHRRILDAIWPVTPRLRTPPCTRTSPVPGPVAARPPRPASTHAPERGTLPEIGRGDLHWGSSSNRVA